MLKTAEDLLRMWFNASSAGQIAAVTERLVSRQITPYAAGELLLEGMGA
jgi:hypothetical protein